MNKFHPSQGVRCLYIRNRHGHHVGLVMTQVSNGVAKMGWSLCKRKAQGKNMDVFRKSEAKVVAFSRLAEIPTVEVPKGLNDTPMNRALVALSESDKSVPQSIRHAASEMIAHRMSLVNAANDQQPEAAPIPTSPVMATVTPPKTVGLFERMMQVFGF